MDFLNSISQFIDAHLMGSVAIIGGVVDFGLRLVKSEKPLSVAHAVVGVIKGVGSAASKVAEFLDKILPQKLKVEEKPQGKEE